VFLSIQSLTPFFSLIVPDFLVFFMSLDRKFNEDSKNVLKNMIRSFQVGFKAILSLTVLSNCVFVNLNFDTPFLFDCT